jgi:hypothetical protein
MVWSSTNNEVSCSEWGSGCAAPAFGDGLLVDDAVRSGGRPNAAESLTTLSPYIGRTQLNGGRWRAQCPDFGGRPRSRGPWDEWRPG